MAETLTPELIEQEGYTKPELRWMLAQYRGCKLPPRTLDHWLRELSDHGVTISPNQSGLYEDDDFKLLTRLVFWLKRRRTIAQFAQLIKKEHTKCL